MPPRRAGAIPPERSRQLAALLPVARAGRRRASHRGIDAEQDLDHAQLLEQLPPRRVDVPPSPADHIAEMAAGTARACRPASRASPSLAPAMPRRRVWRAVSSSRSTPVVAQAVRLAKRSERVQDLAPDRRLDPAPTKARDRAADLGQCGRVVRAETGHLLVQGLEVGHEPQELGGIGARTGGRRCGQPRGGLAHVGDAPMHQLAEQRLPAAQAAARNRRRAAAPAGPAARRREPARARAPPAAASSPSCTAARSRSSSRSSAGRARPAIGRGGSCQIVVTTADPSARMGATAASWRSTLVRLRLPPAARAARMSAAAGQSVRADLAHDLGRHHRMGAGALLAAHAAHGRPAGRP